MLFFQTARFKYIILPCQKKQNLRPKGVHVCVDDDEDEGDDEVEDQPDIDHLDVSRRGEALVHLFIK